VQEVAAFPSEVGVTLRDSSPLLLVVVRPVLLPRECPLLAFQAFALVGEVERPDCCAVGVVGVLANPNVDTDALLGILRRFRWLSAHLDAKGGDPLTRRLFFECDLLNRGVVLRNRGFLMGCTRAVALVNVGDSAVKPNRYIRKFRE